MAILSFCGKRYTVDHVVKGADYIHGYDAAGLMVVSFEGVADFSKFTYDGEFMSPEMCEAEGCNETILVNGSLKTKDGRRVSAEQVGARPNTWMPSAKDVSATPASHAEDKTNPHGVTIEQIGAAPAGCGFGDRMTYVNMESAEYSSMTFEDALESILTTMPGYSCAQVQFHVPIDNGGYHENTFVGKLWKYTPNDVILEAINYSGYSAIKCKIGGIWNPWEWVNPPMSSGVEYRTTERFDGETVYCKVVSYTNSANIGNSSSVEDVEIPHNISGFGKLVRVTGRQLGVNVVPSVTTAGNTFAVVSVKDNFLTLRLNKCSFDSRTWYFSIYYTK